MLCDKAQALTDFSVPTISSETGSGRLLGGRANPRPGSTTPPLGRSLTSGSSSRISPVN
jgi:hypothetical protein